MPELHKLLMVGHLLVCWFVGPHDNDDDSSFDPLYYEPIEVPPELSLRVAGSDQPKRFELYSFTMSQKMGLPHSVSYVKRANGQWWFCDDLASSNSKVSTESLPITIEKQRALSNSSYPQRPSMAFYLRTEQ